MSCNEGSIVPSNIGSISLAVPQELPPAGSSSQENTPATASNTNFRAAPLETDEDQGLSLAQRRSRRIDVPMPLRFRQYEDVLPQPPPTVPSGYPADPNPPETPTDALITSRSSFQAPPFRTAKNVFGLVRQFFSSIPPSHDPEEVVTLQDISSVAPAKPDSPAPPHDLAFHPYPNRSSFDLGNWYWNGTAQKSHQDFKQLIDIVGCSDFDPDDVRSTSWDRINSKLGSSADDGCDEWEDEDAGWRKTTVTIQVPFSRTTAHPDARPYPAADLYHRSIVSIIREKLSNAHDDEYFHYEPYRLQWSAPHLPREVNIQGELYTSPAFMDAHRELQGSPREVGCDLPRVVVALMFWSDATHLTTFGNARLWPVYMYFGNESKYRRCKPSCNLSNHVAYFQKLPDSFKDFAGTYTNGKGVGRECTTHCQHELFQAQWKVLLDDELLEAYEHGIVILCCDGIKRRFYPRIFTYSADYPEK
ncbi:hypothetical protein EV424DRAFT_1310326 [Suillus variegatus]|nr:hypothetical protein EV424DRAFT_1310326 [Suillus variegatus]